MLAPSLVHSALATIATLIGTMNEEQRTSFQRAIVKGTVHKLQQNGVGRIRSFRPRSQRLPCHKPTQPATYHGILPTGNPSARVHGVRHAHVLRVGRDGDGNRYDRYGSDTVGDDGLAACEDGNSNVEDSNDDSGGVKERPQ